MSATAADGGPEPATTWGARAAVRSSVLASTVVGDVLVVHPAGDLGDGARRLALGAASDPDCDLLVVDLPQRSGAAAWDEVAALVPRSRRRLRLVVEGAEREVSALAGRWLAGRLHRTVVVPDGEVEPGVGGTLFVDGGEATGWVSFQGARPARWESKRYPQPSWEVEALADRMPTGPEGVAEPLPAGTWLHRATDAPSTAAHRVRLRRALPSQPDAVAVVLGCPGEAPVPVDEVARLWFAVPPALRGRLRLLRYGAVDVPPGASWSQVLADLVDDDVTCYPGVPVGTSAVPDVMTVLPDGALGWSSCARELTVAPRRGRGPSPVHVASHRSPLPSASLLAPRTYRYAPDAVVEVVPCGLWVRPPGVEAVVGAAAVRGAAVDDEVCLVVHDDGAAAGRMLALAVALREELDGPTRQRASITPASALVTQAEDGAPAVPGRALRRLDLAAER